MTGIELIAAERRRQIETKGYTPQHDDAHTGSELAQAAACYAQIETMLIRDYSDLNLINDWARANWPWDESTLKVNRDPVRMLVKAGALIIAEIDRLQRINPPKFEDSLTPAELAAPTFTEWSDATLARAVREIASDLKDAKGFRGMVITGAALALVTMMEDSNAGTLNIEIDGTRISIRLPGSDRKEKES